MKIQNGGRRPSWILMLCDVRPFQWILVAYGFHPVKFERHSSNGSQVMAFPKSKMAAGRHLGFYFLRISSRRDALVLVRAYSWQNFNILAQTVQKL